MSFLGVARDDVAETGLPLINPTLTTPTSTGGTFTTPTIGTPTITGLVYESASNALTAFAGGGQTNALKLVSEINVIGTVATAGDSIALPVSAPGLTIVVINKGANACQVYGQGTDTIDGVATATGVSQMVNSMVIYSCAVAGAWYSEGLATGWAGPGLQALSFSNGLTAHAGGGQGAALALTSMVNRVTTVATAGDSVALPAATAGLAITVINSGANPMQVFGAGTDTINGVATATGVSQMQNSVCLYVCTAAGLWQCEGIGSGFAGTFPTVSTVNGLTAHSGGGQALGTPCTAVINRFTTVAVAADSGLLPASSAGMQITVTNAAAANSMNLFPATGEQINALGANAAFAIAAGKTASLSCAVAGQWHAVLSA